MAKIEAIEYNENADPVEVISTFEWVEDVMAWCEARRGEPLEWGDTNFGYNGMTIAEREASADGMPPKWYEVHGIEEDGETIRELEEDDHKDGEFK